MLLEEKSRQDLLAGRRLEISGLSGEDPLHVLEKTHPGEKFITAATPLSEDTPLMTSRYCLKQALGYCPREEGVPEIKGSEPLYLVRGKKKFPVFFDCQACLMFVEIGRASCRERVYGLV